MCVKAALGDCSVEASRPDWPGRATRAVVHQSTASAKEVGIEAEQCRRAGRSKLRYGRGVSEVARRAGKPIGRAARALGDLRGATEDESDRLGARASRVQGRWD